MSIALWFEFTLTYVHDVETRRPKYGRDQGGVPNSQVSVMTDNVLRLRTIKPVKHGDAHAKCSSGFKNPENLFKTVKHVRPSNMLNTMFD
jgi:hypothetical protein